MQTDKNDVLDLARRVCTVQYFPADMRGLHIVSFQVCQCGKAKVLEGLLTLCSKRGIQVTRHYF